MTVSEEVLYGFAAVSLAFFAAINFIEALARRHYLKAFKDNPRRLYPVLSIFYTHHDLLDDHMKNLMRILVILLAIHVVISLAFVAHHIYVRA